ncbi:MAG: MBL fold metallo-hydrolase [Proteobacteria bacterium]|nr:MBL fold metallo-hydrolase [Pseudomonadota bacterium]
MITVIFRQFCTADKEISYLLADAVTRQAALIDANVLAVKEYLETIENMDLTLLYVMETHAHESHRSASALLRKQLDTQLVAHKAAQLDCTDLAVGDEDCVFIGEECTRVIATPGHSRCSLCFHWRDRVFTGHTLLAGKSGLCQREDSEPADMLKSIQKKLLTLPDETLIYPGRINENRCVSSIAQERTDNADVKTDMTKEMFIQHKRQEAINKDTWQQDFLFANQRCNY